MDRTGRVSPPPRRKPLRHLAWLGLGWIIVGAVFSATGWATVSPTLVSRENPAGFAAFSDVIGPLEPRFTRLTPPDAPGPANPVPPPVSQPPLRAIKTSATGVERLPPLDAVEPDLIQPSEPKPPLLLGPANARHAPANDLTPAPVNNVPLNAAYGANRTSQSAATPAAESTPEKLPELEFPAWPSGQAAPQLPTPQLRSSQTPAPQLPTPTPPTLPLSPALTAPTQTTQPSAAASLPSPEPSDLEPLPRGPLHAMENTTSTVAPAQPSARNADVERIPAPAAAPAPVAEVRSQEIELVAQEADKHTRRGFELATHTAYYAARSEFIAALRLVAQGLDSQEHTNRHSRALADALMALRECEDFVPRGGRLEADLDVPAIARLHRTPVLHESKPDEVTSLEATCRYMTFAQEQLAAAADHEVAGSMALFGLGKLHAALAVQPGAGVACAEGKAMACFQASLTVFPHNHLASNELGVLLVRSGRYADARVALEHSVAASNHQAGWHNLAVVYRQLGETALAQRADAIARAGGSRTAPGAAGNSAGQMVDWVDPQSFAQSFAETPAARQPLPARAAAAATAPAASSAAPAEKWAAARWWPWDTSSNSDKRQ